MRVNAPALHEVPDVRTPRVHEGFSGRALLPNGWVPSAQVPFEMGRVAEWF